MIKAESRDAGAAFRLVGFYPSVDGGEASLEVNLDAGGPATKSGTLWARDFDRARRSGGERRAHRSKLGRRRWGQRKQAGQQSSASRSSSCARRSRSAAANSSLKDAYMNGRSARRHHARHGRFQVADRRSRRHLCAAYGLNSALRGDSHSRPGAGRPPGRGPGRHHLRHQGQARRPLGAGQSDVGDDARHLPADFRVHRHGADPNATPPASSFMQPGQTFTPSVQ